jgi:hypothetical protein
MTKTNKLQFAALSLVILGNCIFWAVGDSRVSAEDFIIEPKKVSDSTTQDQRLLERKDEFKSQIDAQAQKKLADKCEQVSKTLKSFKDKDTQALNTRHDKYVSYSDKLEFITNNLQSRGISTNNIESARQVFIDATNKYLADAAEYKSAIDDLTQIDRSKDPSGYRATILSSRKLRNQLAVDIKAVKATFTQIQSAVDQAKKSLSAKAGGN